MRAIPKTLNVYSKLNLRVKYSPPHTSKTWDFNRYETYLINCSTESFDCSNLYPGKNAHEQGELFSKTLLKCFNNFIP